MLVGIRQIILLDNLGITFAHATIEVTANCDLPFWALYYIGVLVIITQSCSQKPRGHSMEIHPLAQWQGVNIEPEWSQ